MATLATLIVKLAADVGGFSAEMEKAKLKTVKTAEQVSKAWKKVGSDLAGVGRSLSATVTAPVVAAAGLAVKAASDESESWNKVTVVFGNNAAAIREWAKDSANSLGVSRNAAYQAAGSFGNLFVTAGVVPDEVLKMSTSLVKLSGDLGSFHNADPTDVMQSIQSALVGQVEPMRKYGVMLSQEGIAAKAAALGLADVNGKMSDAAKMQAIYAIILEQTKTAQGDFANTSDGLANQLRILKGQFEDTGSSIGQMLLPYALQLLGWVRQGITWFQALDPSIQRNILIVIGLAAALGPLLVMIGSVVSAIGTLIPVVTAIAGVISGPVLLVIGIVVGVLALLYLAWTNNWLGIRDITQAVVDWISGKIQYGLHWMNNWWKHHQGHVMFVVRTLWGGVVDVVTFAWNLIQFVVGLGVALVQAIWERHGAAILQILGNTWEIITNTFKGWMTAIGYVFKAFAAAFRGDWRGFGENLRKAWDALWDMVVKNLALVWDNIKIVFGEWWRNTVDFFTTLDWKSIGQAIIDGIVNGLISGEGTLLGTVKKIGNAFKEAWKGFWGIASPSKVTGIEFGLPMALGVERYFVQGILGMIGRLPGVMGGLMPAMATAGSVEMPGFGGLGAVSTETGRGGGGLSITVNYGPFITSSDERQAKSVLTRIIVDVVREYLPQYLKQ